MLAKKHRLPWNIKFDKKAAFFSAYLFNARIRQNDLLHNRFAVLVSKRIDKRATVRNKIRRLIYVAAEELSGKLGKGLDVLFSIKRAAIGKTKQDFFLAMEDLLEKEGFLK